MTLQIELDSQQEAQLTEEAHKRGLELQTYAEQLLMEAVPPRPEPRTPMTAEELDSLMEDFRRLGPKELPFDDQNWSRDIIYGDHP